MLLKELIRQFLAVIERCVVESLQFVEGNAGLSPGRCDLALGTRISNPQFNLISFRLNPVQPNFDFPVSYAWRTHLLLTCAAPCQPRHRRVIQDRLNE